MELTSDSVALVTGAASGLGLATARRLAATGAHLVLVDLERSGGGDVARGLGERAVFAPADVTDGDAVGEAVEVAADTGPLRVAVNCAGIGTPARVLSRDAEPTDLDGYRTVLEVNLIGTFNVVRLAAAAMARNDPVGEERGVIVNTASAAAFDGQVGQAAYAASKAGVAGMTLPLARDLGQWQVRVMTIAPGLFRTPLLSGLPREAIMRLERQVPHPARLGEPDEFAQLVESIVANPMLNGEVIRLDGAIRMAPR